MSALIKCDKCGKTEKTVKGFMHIRAYPLESATSYESRSCKKVMDVCLECYEKIFKEDK